MWRPRRHKQSSLPIDATLRRIVLLFRLLGWGWMAVLVVLTPANDPDASMVIGGGAMVLATVWTAATWRAAGDSAELGQPWLRSWSVLRRPLQEPSISSTAAISSPAWWSSPTHSTFGTRLEHRLRS